ncbi:MAG: hypothetical protein ACP5I7_03490 [Sulfolobales archaeon]|jgi:hypothetical protein
MSRSSEEGVEDPIYPRLGGVLSAFSSLLSIYLSGLALLVLYLFTLSIIRDLIMNSLEDPLYRNIALLLVGGLLTILWLATWYLTILYIRKLLSRSR